MSFAWPWALLALLLAPLMLIIHWLIQRRRRRLAIRVSSVSLIKVAMTERSRWRRRLPIGLLLASLATLGIGAARPTGSRDVPVSSTSILLTLDVSRSMCSTDVPPNRLTVAQNAARSFIKAQHNGTKIGIVAFAGIAALIVPPTTDDTALLKAIDNLTTSRGTAIGLAILASIDAIAEVNPHVAPTGIDLGTTGDTPPSPNSSFEPDTIVVLTDGANTRGVEPVTAAEQAAARHIRVYTIGFGTTTPSPPVCNVDQFGDDPVGPDNRQFGGGGGGGGGGGFGGPPGRFLEIDEPTLQKVADVTGGTYFRAKDASQLVDVFSHLPSEFVVQHEEVEWTSWFVLVAAIFAAGAVGLSLLWNRYP